MPPILDVAIGTVFVFLLFSLVVSALNEVILSYFDQRAKFLRMGLKELLGTDAAAPKSGWRHLVDCVSNLLKAIGGWIKSFFVAPSAPDPDPNDRVQALCNHGLINALSRSDKSNSPSYIPAGAFVTSLLDQLVNGKLNASVANPPVANAILDLTSGDIPQALKDAIAALPENDKLKQGLSSLLAIAGQNLGKFKTAIEAWFNDAMDRVSGWYKRFAQKWMIVIGLVLAAILNVDTLRIVDTLSKSPNLAKALATQAGNYSKTSSPPGTYEHVLAAHKSKEDAIKKANEKLGAAKAAKDIDKSVAAQKDLDEAVGVDATMSDFNASITKLKDTGIPMGWEQAQKDYWKQAWLLVIAGWFLTAIAASLGAPFWFDVLGRFINIRNSGKDPNEKDRTGASKNKKAVSLNRTPRN